VVSYERGTPVLRRTAQTIEAMLNQGSDQVGANRPFSIVLVCSTSRRIPTSASTNEGPDKGDLILSRRTAQTIKAMLNKAAIVKNKVAHRKLLEQVRANMAHTRANVAHTRANMAHIRAHMAHIRANMAHTRPSRPDSGRGCLMCVIAAIVKNKVAHRKLLEQVRFQNIKLTFLWGSRLSKTI